MDSSTEDEMTVELTGEEKVLIMELMVHELFSEKNKESANVRLQNCETESCSKPKYSEFTRETRRMIIKELIREFYLKTNESKECFVSENDINVTLSPVEEKILLTIFNSKLKGIARKSETPLNVTLKCSETNNKNEDNVKQSTNGDELSNMPTRPSSRRHSEENKIDKEGNLIINADELIEPVFPSVQDSENTIEEKDKCDSIDSQNKVISVNTDEEMLEEYEDCTEPRASEKIEIVDLRSTNSSVICLPEIFTNEDQNKIGLSESEEAEISQIIMLAENVNDEKKYTDHESNASYDHKNIINNRHDTKSDCSDVTYENKVERFLESCREMVSKRNSDSERDTESRRRKISYLNKTQEKQVDHDLSDDRLNDCVKMKWKINGDELTVKTCQKDSSRDTTRVSTKEEFQISWQRTEQKCAVGGSRQKIPMNDETGPYYIDKKLVPTWIYQEGLMFSRWNPTQVLYEICSQCHWPTPDFIELGYCVEKGFHIGVRVNDHNFLPKERGHSKQLAKHFASANFLRFLGFKFSFKNYKDFVANFSQTNLKSWNTETDLKYTRKKTSEDSKALFDTDEKKSLSRNPRYRERSTVSRSEIHVKRSNTNSRYNFNSDRSCAFPKRNISNYKNYCNDTSGSNRHRIYPYLRMDQVEESTRYKYKLGQSSHKRNRSPSSSSSESTPDRKRSYNYLTSTHNSRRRSTNGRSVQENSPRHRRRTNLPSTSTGPLNLNVLDHTGVPRIPPHLMQQWLENFISPSLEEIKAKLNSTG